MNRTILGSTLTIAALAIAPSSAFAKSYDDSQFSVCNEASVVSQGGTLDALDGDPFPHPARFQNDLHAHRGHGVGLVNAAKHSPALALCKELDGIGGGTGGDGGGDGSGDGGSV
jgi:hypothetical protein